MRISQKVLEYYYRNQRNLPWRETRDPYHIWLSEVILQQTRIDQGMSYYRAITARFPGIFDLANADEDELLKLWQGLGYYSRALNLHKAAKIIAFDRNGQFPANYSEWKMLPGVGDYTASAIASIVYDEVVPAIDGNVNRVIARLFAVDLPVDKTPGKAEIRSLMVQLLPYGSPGDFNQAMMEYGAMVCKPRNPDCSSCVVRNYCEAYRTGRVLDLPVKKNKSQIRQRYTYYIVAKRENEVLISKRNKDDIWKGLYEFPCIERASETDPTKILESKEFRQLIQEPFTLDFIQPGTKHRLSHQEIIPCYIGISCDEPVKGNTSSTYLSEEQFNELPLPRMIDRFVNEHRHKIFG